MTHPAQTPEGTTTATEKGSSVVGARGQDVPEGWKLVPIRPTMAMLEAAHKAFQIAAPSLIGFNAKERAYAAMLDHVPEFPATPDPVSPAPSVEPITPAMVEQAAQSVFGLKPWPGGLYRFSGALNALLRAFPTPAQADALDAARLLADLVNAKRWRDAAIKRMEADDDGEYERADAALDAAWEVAMRKGD